MAEHESKLRGSMDLMILAILARQPSYGYQIQKELDGLGPDYAGVQVSTLYRSLYRLEGDRLIRSRWDHSESRPRKWYELTAAGRRLLKPERALWRRQMKRVLDWLEDGESVQSDAEPRTSRG